ncbi:hypothetical protein DPMN_098013, partial [Dreissena polymorpha]
MTHGSASTKRRDMLWLHIASAKQDWKRHEVTLLQCCSRSKQLAGLISKESKTSLACSWNRSWRKK